MERYERQVEKIRNQMVAARNEQTQLSESLAEERALGTQRQRLEEMAKNGLTMLLSDDIPPREANIFFRQRVRLWVEKRGITRVEWL